MKWNKKKFVKNISSVLIVIAFSIVVAYGMVWGLEQEQEINRQATTMWINEK